MTDIVEISIPKGDDLDWVSKNYVKSILKPFECSSIKELFENTTWSLILKENAQIKAYAAFYDGLPILFENSEQMAELNTENQLQINGVNSLLLCIALGEITTEYMDLILMDTFRKLPFLKYCCLITNNADEVDNVFKQPSWRKVNFKKDILFYKERKDVMPEVGIRSKRCEDYIALRNLFSQMYSSLSTKELQNFTLDFLDFGEDKYPTYKYLTYDEDNTYIAVADAYKGEAVGFIFATILRVDLKFLKKNFQLEAVQGLKKYPLEKIYNDHKNSNQAFVKESSTDEDEIIDTKINGISSQESNVEQILATKLAPSTSNYKATELDVENKNVEEPEDTKIDNQNTNREDAELDVKYTNDKKPAKTNMAINSKQEGKKLDAKLTHKELTDTKIDFTSNQKEDKEFNVKHTDEEELTDTRVANVPDRVNIELDVNEIDSIGANLAGSEEEPTNLYVERTEDKKPTAHKLSDTFDQDGIELDIKYCLDDILNNICTATKENGIEFEINNERELKSLFDSKQFDLSNEKHLSLITDENLSKLPTGVLVELINSEKFDTTKTIHMKLVSKLGEKILEIKPEKQNEILRSILFDPSIDEFALVALYMLDKLPNDKLVLFQKSSIGLEIYEKVKYKHAISKQQSEIKLSYADKQAIRREAQKMTDRNKRSISYVTEDYSETCRTNELKNIGYKNMGFISGMPSKEKCIQNNYSATKEKLPIELPTSMDYINNKYTGIGNSKYNSSLDKNIHFYSGIDNCFFVEQLAVEKNFEHEILNLITAGFKFFPMMDYCILLLPYGTKQVPVLRHHFASIPARPFSAYDKELFVFHKAGLNRTYSVRPYQESDFQDITNLIHNSCLKNYLLEDLNSNLGNSDCQAISLISEGQLLGIAIISAAKEFNLFKRNYDIGNRVDMKYHKHTRQGELRHCVLHPIAKFLAPIFLKEVMRISQKSILYNKIYPSLQITNNPSYWQSLCNVLDQLIPLKPVAKQQKQSLAIRLKNDNSSTKNSDNKNFSLCFTCTKIVLKDKVINSSRIFITGSSDISFGVLESLIYTTNYRFTNLTLVTESRAISEYRMNMEEYEFLPYRSSYTQDQLDRMNFPVWVTIIQGRISTIKNNTLTIKSIAENDGQFLDVGFDYLVLCEDLQFQTHYLKEVEKENQIPGRYSFLKNIRRNYEVREEPSNVFVVNDEDDSEKLLNWLRKTSKNIEEAIIQPQKATMRKLKTIAETQWEKGDGKIVIHGNCLEAFIAIAAILYEKLPIFKIVYVKSPELNKCGFNNKTIKRLVEFMLEKEDLEIYDGILEYEKEAEQIYYVKVITEIETIRLDCCALLLFNTKNINYTTYNMLHQSSLSFTLPLKNSNGYPYLIINENFQTNVESIFAVGSITKMLLKNGNSLRLEDINYNCKEIGLIVGTKIEQTISEGRTTSNSKTVLKLPKVKISKLVRGYRYIVIDKPHSYFLEKTGNKSNSNNNRKILVLGNLKTGKSIVPQPLVQENSVNKEDEDKIDQDYDLANSEMEAEKTSEEKLKNTSATENNESQLQDDSESPSMNLTLPESKSNQANQEFPETPEFFAVTINETDNVERIECFTNKTIDLDSLISLYGIQATQLYKIIQLEEDENHKLFFSLMEDWILPLDYFTFVDEEVQVGNIEEGLIGYDSYWRPEYPTEMETKINVFLRSFTKRKYKK